MSTDNSNNPNITQDASITPISAPPAQSTAAPQAQGASSQMQPSQGNGQSSDPDVIMNDAPPDVAATAETTRQAHSGPHQERPFGGLDQSIYAANNEPPQFVLQTQGVRRSQQQQQQRPAAPRAERRILSPRDAKQRMQDTVLRFIDAIHNVTSTNDNQLQITNREGRSLQLGTVTRVDDGTFAAKIPGGKGLEAMGSMMNSFGVTCPLNVVVQRADRTLDSRKNFVQPRGVTKSPFQRGLPTRRAPRQVPQTPNTPIVPRHPAARPGDRPLPRQTVPCPNCRRLGHTLADCICPISPEGDIPGCWRCNVLNHTIDDCKRPKLTDHDRWIVEVEGRAGLPPLRSARSWTEFWDIKNPPDLTAPLSRQCAKSLDPRYFQAFPHFANRIQKYCCLRDTPGRFPKTEEDVRSLPDQGFQDPRRAAASSIPATSALQENMRGATNNPSAAPIPAPTGLHSDARTNAADASANPATVPVRTSEPSLLRSTLGRLQELYPPIRNLN